MKKSNEIKHLKKIPEVNYSELPSNIEEAIERKPYTIEEKAKLSWDGKQFLVRIPSEITNEIELTDKNRVLFTLIKSLPNSNDNPELKIEIL